MKLRVTSRFAMFIALALIALIGVLLVLVATPEGAGLSDDSIAYIAGARSLADGHGYREAWHHMGHDRHGEQQRVQQMGLPAD